MKYHAEFFYRNLNGDLASACGDRSVIILDGRISSVAMHAISADECKKRGYLAYRINKGESFTRCLHGRLISVESATNLQTISARLNQQAKGNDRAHG